MDSNTICMAIKLDAPDGVRFGEDGRWYKCCHSCGNEQSYLRKNYAILSFKEKKLCKSCSNSIPDNNSHKGWIKGVLRASFIRKYETNAELRGLSWSLDYDYLADLLIEQDFKCALSGWDIDAMESNSNTASLDRIDSSIGYEVGNVQWVHKMLNMCKQNYSQEAFIEMCSSVADKVKW